ncbi:hypothetical protein JCM9279_003612 [Rhodotorula babjevae]
MPPRFWSSPYKNSLLTPAKREAWFSELPTASAPASDSSDPIASAGAYFLAQGSAGGALVAVPWSETGKHGGRARVVQTGLGRIGAFAADPWGELLAAAGHGGQINVLALPSLDELAPGQPFAPSPLLTLRIPSSKPVDSISFHPLASSLFLATSATSLSVFDASGAAGAGEAAYEVEMPVQAWCASWSAEGRLVSAGGKDGKLRLWDVRRGGGHAVIEIASHAGLKPSRHVHLSHLSYPALFSTGFSRTRDREFSVVDLRSPGTSLKTQRIDSGTGLVAPLVDAERGLVYLAGRGDQTLRWVEVPASAGQSAPYNEGACALPFPAQGAALAPPRELELMRAEIGRVAVLGAGGEVVPVRVDVPRRQYLDFHRELYPPVAAGVPAQTAAEWRAASPDDVAFLDKHQPDPSVAWPAHTSSSRSGATASSASAPAPAPAPAAARTPSPAPASAPASSSTAQAAPAIPIVQQSPSLTQARAPQAAPSSSSSPAPSPAPTTSTSSRPSFGTKKLEPASASAQAPAPAATAAPAPAAAAAPPTAQLSSLSLGDGGSPSSASSRSAPAPSPAPMPSPAPAVAKPAPQPQTLGDSTTPGAPFNPGWSRKFLTGKTPLKPDFFDVHDLSATMSADVALLKASPTYLFYPLSGPGGRLAFHPLSRPGRLPVHPSCVAVGGAVVEFCVNPFDPRRVCVAGEDGAVRVFALPSEDEWKEAETRSEARVVLSDAKMDRISELLPHPAAKNLLLTISDDRGNPTARLWDMYKGDKLLELALPKGGTSSAAWSPSGSRLAFATKKKELYIVDPRDLSSSLVSAPGHDSIRPSRLAWASEEHIVSSGFNRAASRELILFHLSPSTNQLVKLGATQLDVSPAPLFPFVDLDTRIVLLHSRGDRSCLAYTVNLAPKDAYDAFEKLPSFEAGGLQSGWAFLPKARGDVRKVEIVKGLRLTPSTIEVVAFTVPRAKADFFQNDVFVPTRNVEKPSMSAAEYLEGENRPLDIIDLRPEGMELLSNAPAPVKNVSTRSKIKQDGLTDSQREKQHLDSLFESAKADEDSEEDEAVQPVRASHRIEQDDDEW